MKEERAMTSKLAATVPVSSPIIEDTLSHFITKERSLSPFGVSRIQEHQREENCTVANHHILPSSNSIPKKQIAVVNEFILFPPDGLQSQRILQEDDENALHGSSEFMLVLYPEDDAREEYIIDRDPADIRVRDSISTNKSLCLKHF